MIIRHTRHAIYNDETGEELSAEEYIEAYRHYILALPWRGEIIVGWEELAEKGE